MGPLTRSRLEEPGNSIYNVYCIYFIQDFIMEESLEDWKKNFQEQCKNSWPMAGTWPLSPRFVVVDLSF